MAHYNTLNVKASNFQLKFGTKSGAEVSIIGNANDENNFPHKFLLTNTQVWKLSKAFANNSSTNIKLSNLQLHKIGNQEDF